ncbi:hypothetical protein NHF50_01050 [Flavobacterium sp. NRK F10]|uniref:hypothetical protein n=1 Tax=Flavobacterium sp. NRK F10 TaxID=2954931 RepID=UPI0020906A20|nr:hypothetical protein [Flavobacterium sp. NRK F10]MCO6173623.1 hypothetical protein [Flavobacterium sp. NRK F10]
MKIKQTYLILFFSLIFFSCTNKEKPVLFFETPDLEKFSDTFTICETSEGVEIYINNDFKDKISNQKIKNFSIKYKNKEIVISLFNILHSSNKDKPHQSPTTPKGSISVFNDNGKFFIDIKSKSKSDFYDLLADMKISNCNNQ